MLHSGNQALTIVHGMTAALYFPCILRMEVDKLLLKQYLARAGMVCNECARGWPRFRSELQTYGHIPHCFQAPPPLAGHVWR